MKTLPKEFAELNNTVKTFNKDLSTLALFGEGHYLLLQGNRIKGYDLHLMKGKTGEGAIYQTLIRSANKKRIVDSFNLLDVMALGAMTRAVTKPREQ